ncbi:hypothetical protein GGF50DRAFT_45113 [Schizophyllum commune]
MQAHQMYAHGQSNKGTLVPGQSIAVNKYTVQVERYLSQGGFAHVYLVRTATPVYGTTHHVLKRIAVANDAMLTEVKQEVDIMRLLRGHPNIVHLIDAAWHKLPNATYEVFILMEFCPGGGIIDMMNRRLRERLTEAEILQIFVDVCEGVAYMHNSRPPLLHRDLKVENILQSSPTSFKLCDFGSAATVRRPPTTMQEIRAVEADLNRHTTLQYRAPEMVDPYQRRPIDEKSDVWALGVLLYKLCYYTTPFEEHGPLAILNVQYRIPPYPVYSANMNALIASMLREHGTQRPSVFEVLNRVHALRGTKSPYNYVIPTAQPLSPSASRIVSPLDNTISYRSSSQAKAAISSSPTKNPGVQARDKVLEAIAPMRRGRPAGHERSKSKSKSRPTTPSKEQANWLDGDFNAAEEKAWQAVSSQAGTPAKKPSSEDAWAVHANEPAAAPQANKTPGFGDDFAEKLWDSFDPKAKQQAANLGASNGPSMPSSLAPKATITPRVPSFGAANLRRAPTVSTRPKGDAFEGLGIASSNREPAPTLGEARKLRTGLAYMSSSTTTPSRDTGASNLGASTTNRPTPSPRPNYLSASTSQQQPSDSRSPVPSPNLRPVNAGGWRPSPSPSAQGDGDAETRFPSLEELDKTFGTPGSEHPPSSSYQSSHMQALSSQYQASNSHHQPSSSPSNVRLPPSASSQPNLEMQRPSSSRTGTSSFLRPSGAPMGNNGVKSAHVTGVAMRDHDARGGSGDSMFGNARMSRMPLKESPSSPTRPPLTRKHRSSVSIKHSPQPSADDYSPSDNPPKLPPRRQQPMQQTDWLTGDDEAVERLPSNPTAATSSPIPIPANKNADAPRPVVRESPSKRASVMYMHVKQPSQGEQGLIPEPAPAPSPRPSPAPGIEATPSTASAYRERAERMFPALDIDTKPVVASPQPTGTTQSREEPPSSADEDGPEDAGGFQPMMKSKETPKARHKARQSSVHDLVDLWGGGLTSREKEQQLQQQQQQQRPPSSAAQKRRSAMPSLSGAPPMSASPGPDSRRPPSPRKQHKESSSITSARQQAAAVPRSPGPASPMSARSTSSRPQSMFLFPSQSPEMSSGNNNLAAPEAQKPRAGMRRTSISDMVQKYEAIGGKVRPVASPAPINTSAARPSGLRAPEQGGLRRDRSPTSPSFSTGNGNLPLPQDTTGRFTHASRSSSPTGLPSRYSPGPSPTSIGMPRSSPLMQNRELKQETELPYKPRVRKPSATPSAGVTRPDPPSRKQSEDSPEPYQGVGKLIQQWQRKQEESDPSRDNKRGGNGSGGLVAGRRAALVGASGRG